MELLGIVRRLRMQRTDQGDQPRRETAKHRRVIRT